MDQIQQLLDLKKTNFLPSSVANFLGEKIAPHLADWPNWAINAFVYMLFLVTILLVIDIILDKSSSKLQTKSNEDQRKSGFLSFQRQFLWVYLIIMLADWLQGTNMYTLYSSYGVNVGALFITGFSSSFVFGTFLGILVDRFGRKMGCIIFCLLEIVINILEHYNDFSLLVLGRIMGGISTSLLFSAFESWYVSEHRNRGYPEEWLTLTFGYMSVGNGIVAIIAGLIAQVSADKLGDIGPFQVAIALTVLTLFLILPWTENKGGDQEQTHSQLSQLSHTFKQAYFSMVADVNILLLGLIQSLFEGAMYTFVFTWVPTLIAIVPDNNLPTGLVFSSFMLCITAGGIVYKWSLKFMDVGKVSIFIFLLAALSMIVPIYYKDNYLYTLIAFLVMELCVGMFNACAATMRSEYIPDELQSSIMNIFRIPLNLLVVIGTFLAENSDSSGSVSYFVFGVCSSWFFLAAVLQVILSNRPKKLKSQ